MKALTSRHALTAVALVGVGALLAGCSGGGGGDSAADADCSPYEAYGTEFGDSPEVEVYSTIVDTEADKIVESWADFESCTGIAINLVGTQEAETQINVRVAAGDAPDLMIIPQPGLLNRLIEGGYVKPAPEAVQKNVDEFWSPSWKSYGTGTDGVFYAAPLMASVKGWIWYSPSEFADKGIDVPTTWDELMAATEKLAEADSATYKPWCAGFASGDATGWPGTDWVEDLVLREQGADVYNQWVAGEIPFTDSRIQDAFDAVGDILKRPEFVNGGFGGVESINSTTFQDAGLPILDGNCSMMHQASFYESQWPEGTTVAPDGDVWAFLTPKANESDPDAVTGGGEFVAAFNDNDATAAVQAFLSSDTWANSRVSLGGVISANKGLDPNNASSPLGKASIEILQGEDTVFAFDGSDLMPASIGTGAFWTGMVDWISGDSTAQVTERIESAR